MRSCGRVRGPNYPFLTAKERDNETGLDYFLARYYSSTQGRFTSVDPDNAGANEDDPQSWNGYAYARNNPAVITDPDGLRYRVCDSTGKCQNHWDDQWKPLFDPNNASSAGVVLQGDRNSGKIFNAEGEQIGTYQFVDHDYWSDFQNGVVSALRDPETWTEAAKQSAANVVAGGMVRRGGVRSNLSSVDRLSRAAAAPDRGGLTKAGRSLTKHASGQRPGSSKVSFYIRKPTAD